MGNSEVATVEDWRAQRIGEAVLEALQGLHAEVWFDVGLRLASDRRLQRAVLPMICDAPSTQQGQRESRVADLVGAIRQAYASTTLSPADPLAFAIDDAVEWMCHAEGALLAIAHGTGFTDSELSVDREEFFRLAYQRFQQTARKALGVHRNR